MGATHYCRINCRTASPEDGQPGSAGQRIRGCGGELPAVPAWLRGKIRYSFGLAQFIFVRCTCAGRGLYVVATGGQRHSEKSEGKTFHDEYWVRRPPLCPIKADWTSRGCALMAPWNRTLGRSTLPVGRGYDRRGVVIACSTRTEHIKPCLSSGFLLAGRLFSPQSVDIFYSGDRWLIGGMA